MGTVRHEKMILLADSGGSKTDWVLLTKNHTLAQIRTPGLNPSLVGPEIIRSILREQVLPWLTPHAPDEFWFFGAGLNRKTPRNRMKKLLKSQLVLRGCVHVEPDILGAGLACLGAKKGVVGILGTGSVAIRFNGKKITAKKGGLGYLIGDVGGGVALGRIFLRRLVNRDLPKPILQAYPKYSGIAINAVLETLYSHMAPARFLAAQVPFLADHRNDPVISQMISSQFEGFLDVYLAPLQKGNDEKIVFMGGVAKTFESELLCLCRARGMKNTSVHQDPPILALSRYFSKKVFVF